MLPNPYDHALSTLREEVPSLEATARLRATLSSLPLGRGRGGASRRRLARPLTLTMITAALSLVIFYPRAKSGSAWAQTLAATLAAPNLHTVMKNAQGIVTREGWQSGQRRASVDRSDDGSMFGERRSNGRRVFSYFDHTAFGRPTPLNGSRSGLLYDRRSGDGQAIDLASLEKTLNSPELKVVSHADADPAQGKPESYTLRYRKSFPFEFTVEIDTSSRRIVRLLWPSLPPTRIDYPKTLPASIFEPCPQLAKNVTVYDLDALKAIVARRLRDGLGTKGPVTLRLVTLDAEGKLWVFWTGAPPSRNLKPSIRLAGVPSGAPFGMRVFTRDWATATANAGNPHWKPNSPHFGGMGLLPKAKIGPTLDVEVPYPGGTARFARVPVLRIVDLPHFDEELGVQRTYR